MVAVAVGSTTIRTLWNQIDITHENLGGGMAIYEGFVICSELRELRVHVPRSNGKGVTPRMESHRFIGLCISGMGRIGMGDGSVGGDPFQVYRDPVPKLLDG